MASIHLSTFEARSADDLEKVINTQVPLCAAARSAGLSRFCCRPEDAANTAEILLIEEFRTPAVAVAAYWATNGYNPSNLTVRSVLETLATFKEVHRLAPSMTSLRPPISTAEVKEPFVITAMFGYQAGAAEKAIAGWRALVEYCEREEEGVLSYYVAARKRGSNGGEEVVGVVGDEGVGEEIRTW